VNKFISAKKTILIIAILFIANFFMVTPQVFGATKALGEGCSSSDDCATGDFCDSTLPNSTFKGSCNRLESGAYKVKGIGKACVAGDTCISCATCYNSVCMIPDRPHCSPTGYGCNKYHNCIGEDVCDLTVQSTKLPGFESFYKGTCVDPTTQSAGDEAVKADEIQVSFAPQVTIPGSEFQQGESLTLENSTAPIIKYIKAIYNYSISLVGIIGAIMLMIGGFVWVTSGGNAAKVSQAKEFIGASIIGILLTLTSYLLLNAINPDLVAPTPVAVAPTAEQIILKTEACNWKIASTMTFNDNTIPEIKSTGCSSKEVKKDDALCVNLAKPEGSDLDDETLDDPKITGKNPVCCCTQTIYGLAAQESGSSVIDVDTSGTYWCCTITGQLKDINGTTNNTDSISFATIQSQLMDPALTKCGDFLKTTTKTLGGVTYWFNLDKTYSYDVSTGKCTATFADTDPLKDQCKGKDKGTACQYDSTSAVGTGYCAGDYCKRCLVAGDNCYFNDSSFECVGANGLCGEISGSLVDSTADCYNFTDPDPDLTMCWGKQAATDGKVKIGDTCTNGSACTAGACCLLDEAWCFPLKQFSTGASSGYGLTCAPGFTR
jgi:hypothetical protein